MTDQTQWGRAKYSLFRDLFDWWGPSVVAMEGRDETLPPWRDNCEAMIALRRRANAEWEAITGLPPLGDPGKWYAAAMAATEYPLPKVQQMTVDELRAVITAWALSRKASKPVADGTQWSKADSPSEWAKVFGVSARKFARWIKEEKIHANVIDDKNIMVDLRDLPTLDR